MSTFGGRFNEPILDWISVDNFEGINLSSCAFFLSHLHWDHMKGLNENFFENLTNTNKFLYCSKVTEIFIRKKIAGCFNNQNIISLECNKPLLIRVADKSPLEVTSVPAGHCPGSVMFIFEAHDIRILYTGDFRLPSTELYKFKAFHQNNKKVKKFDAIYLDTTFAFPEYTAFPSREESKNEILAIVKEWLGTGVNSRKIGIVPTAKYGLEYLLLELANTLNEKIYVKDKVLFENYKCICELSNVISENNDTRIHLCQQSFSPYNCEICTKAGKSVKRIRPSAMRFTQKCLQLGEDLDGSSEILRIVYSTHCSLDELLAFLKYVSNNGCKINPCVIKDGCTEEEILNNLQVKH